MLRRRRRSEPAAAPRAANYPLISATNALFACGGRNCWHASRNASTDTPLGPERCARTTLQRPAEEAKEETARRKRTVRPHQLAFAPAFPRTAAAERERRWRPRPFSLSLSLSLGTAPVRFPGSSTEVSRLMGAPLCDEGGHYTRAPARDCDRVSGQV